MIQSSAFPHVAEAGNAGTLPMSRASRRMITVAAVVRTRPPRRLCEHRTDVRGEIRKSLSEGPATLEGIQAEHAQLRADDNAEDPGTPAEQLA